MKIWRRVSNEAKLEILNALLRGSRQLIRREGRRWRETSESLYIMNEQQRNLSVESLFTNSGWIRVFPPLSLASLVLCIGEKIVSWKKVISAPFLKGESNTRLPRRSSLLSRFSAGTLSPNGNGASLHSGRHTGETKKKGGEGASAVFRFYEKGKRTFRSFLPRRIPTGGKEGGE